MGNARLYIKILTVILLLPASSFAEENYCVDYDLNPDAIGEWLGSKYRRSEACQGGRCLKDVCDTKSVYTLNEAGCTKRGALTKEPVGCFYGCSNKRCLKRENLSTCSTLSTAEKNYYALWDAESDHLTTSELIDLKRTHGARLLFYRNPVRAHKPKGIDMKRLKEEGYALVPTIHTLYLYTNDPLKRDRKYYESHPDEYLYYVRMAASKMLADPYTDGIAYDAEIALDRSMHRMVMKKIRALADYYKKTFYVTVMPEPNFPKFGLRVEDLFEYAHFVMPFLYNRGDTTSYAEGFRKLSSQWRAAGATRPISPIFDFGRVDYSGITPEEASEVPRMLRKLGAPMVTLFMPHVAYLCRYGCSAESNRIGAKYTLMAQQSEGLLQLFEKLQSYYPGLNGLPCKY